MTNIVSVIMAGGLGKRMNSTKPKVLLEVNNKPMIIHVLEKALQISNNYVLIVVGRYEIEIKNCIEKHINEMEKKKIYYIKQEEGKDNGEPSARGTGHAIKCCYSFLEQLDSSSKLLILSADVPLITVNILKQLSSYNNAVLVSQTDKPDGYGRVFINEQFQPKIIEHKFCPTNLLFYNFINTGIYILNLTFYKKEIVKLEKNSSGEIFLTDLPFEEFCYCNDFSLFANVNTQETLNILNKKLT